MIEERTPPTVAYISYITYFRTIFLLNHYSLRDPLYIRLIFFYFRDPILRLPLATHIRDSHSRLIFATHVRDYTRDSTS